MIITYLVSYDKHMVIANIKNIFNNIHYISWERG